MSEMIFDGYPLSGRYYGGSERKIGIVIGEAFWMLKFRKKTIFGYRYNTVSEYLGSSIFNLLGVPAQETLLGSYQGQEVVACRDFLSPGMTFVPFSAVGESSLDSDHGPYSYSYEGILDLLSENKKLRDLFETTSRFFDTFLIDALLGNFDRHGYNWGFLKKNGEYLCAPIFDNGSCLFPNLIQEEDVAEILSSEVEMKRRVIEFPTSQILLEGKKSSYYEVISSLRFPKVNEALIRIVPKVDLQRIEDLIDSLEGISSLRKEFYKKIIRRRYEALLLEPYQRLEGNR